MPCAFRASYPAYLRWIPLGAAYQSSLRVVPPYIKLLEAIPTSLNEDNNLATLEVYRRTFLLGRQERRKLADSLSDNSLRCGVEINAAINATFSDYDRRGSGRLTLPPGELVASGANCTMIAASFGRRVALQRQRQIGPLKAGFLGMLQ